MQIIWPPAGMRLSGDTFSIRGRIDNETATVYVRHVDANGATNQIEGLVERNGMFWVDDLPLEAGTNEWALVATDAAGNNTSTNLSVIKSAVVITVTSTPEEEALYQPFGTVSGTISDASYMVTVNGVEATVDDSYANGDGSYNWTAENVPNEGQGTTTYDVRAEQNSGGGGGSGGSGGGSGGSSGGGTDGVTITKEQPALVMITLHTNKMTSTYQGGGSTSTTTRSKEYRAERGTNGVVTAAGKTTDYSTTDDAWNQAVYEWTATNRLVNYTSSFGSPSSATNFVEYHQETTCVPDKSVSELGWGGSGGSGGYPPRYIYHYFAKGVEHPFNYPDGACAKVTVASVTETKLYTGGKAGVGRQNLFCLTARAENTESYGVPTAYPWYHTPASAAAAASIAIGGQPVGADYRLYTALPDNAAPVVTVTVKGAKHYNAQSSVEKVRLDLNAVWFQDVADYVLRDNDGSTYSPMWATNEASGKEFGYPALYAAGDQVKTYTGFKVTGGGSFPVRVKGIASGGGTSFTLWGTMDSTGGPYAYVDTVADKLLATNKVDFYKPMTIKWQYAHPSRLEFVDAGRSTNQVYVSLKAPITGNLYHTVVHLACSEPGATTEQTAVENTWGQFTGPNVQAWDGLELYYWQTTAAQPSLLNLPGDTFGLLQKRTGHCAAWAKLLIDAFRVNGVTGVQLLELTPVYDDTIGPPSLLVKNYTFPTSPSLSASYAPFTNRQSEVEDEDGASGQNNDDPKSVFENHFIVRHTLSETALSFYDPSYGKGPWTELESWENESIDGFTQVFMIDNFPTPAAKTNTTGLEVSPTVGSY